MMSLVSVVIWRNISGGISVRMNDIALKNARLEQKQSPNA